MHHTDAEIALGLTKANENEDAALERLFDLLRIPSISTDPAYAGNCSDAAEWLRRELAGLGFAAELHDTAGHPVVLATDHAASGPHVLFYGHYDVQPVDPIELWNRAPFEPYVVTAANGELQIHGRGASDDKGQLMTFVEACRALKSANDGVLPVKVTILIEGEEESGGKNLPLFLEKMKQALAGADIALVCDTDMWDRRTPAITSSLRGLVADDIVIEAANRDLHSGMYGNAARNPNQVLAEIIASLRTPDGAVAVEGFYDGVEDLPEEVRDIWKTLDFDEAAYLGEVGLSVPAGEKGRSVMEQTISRPTCEINGMWGGYTGDGFKTVIPAKASAKISFRLVAGQDPKRIREAFHAHVRARLPADCTVSFSPHGGSPAITIPIDGHFLGLARKALTEEWGREVALVGSGGSIPVAGEFKRILGLDTLLIGFAQTDDNIHSPNEKYNVTSFMGGIRSWIRILAAFGK
ncbi:MAG: M20/M25/M40 family metallo-hydrolase [Alphaproteobacteria bacterium]|nr:M20/M25/M40 family metallo-hydrolase [Alphaproteobacteria bacterium]